ncbi:MAG: potassium-transporting ATPase subunit KdpA [Acidobacteriota bacterium]
MIPAGLLQMVLLVGLLIALAKPLGAYMARVYDGKLPGPEGPFGLLERFLYRVCRIDARSEMGWKDYAKSMVLFHLVGLLVLYGLLRAQAWLPLNPLYLKSVPPFLAFNTAVSFVTNTNWQNYAGEGTLSHLSQMVGLTAQNFLSAASGMAVLAALVRGFARRRADTIGNFWVDVVRTVLYVLLPLSLVLAPALVSQGVVQTFRGSAVVSALESERHASGANALEDTASIGSVRVPDSPGSGYVIPLGPVASQVAIKDLGTNGGGFFNANAAHPFENPTPLSNFLQMLAMGIIGAGLCLTFGIAVGDARQGWAVLSAMLVLLVLPMVFCVQQEQAGNPLLIELGNQAGAVPILPGENMEGKEVRFGATGSAAWATLTTATSCGAVNSMHDSYTPLGGLVPLFLMQLGEVALGGVGSGLYGMLLFVVVAVFAAGLMVGRSPEYLGKKIEPYDMKMASLGILSMPLVVLLGTAVASVTEAGAAGPSNPGIHGFSEILYAFSSCGNNNGSAFAGLNGDTPFYNLALALAMLAGRFLVKIPVLALAGSLARKKVTPAGPGTLPTDSPLFVAWLLAVVVIVGGLTFFPALALGPIAEYVTHFK